MNKEDRLYKDRYVILFYERDDDTLKYMFDNIRQVCKELKWELNQRNLNIIQVNIARSLRRKNHQTNLFRGQCLRVYIVDVCDESE